MKTITGIFTSFAQAENTLTAGSARSGLPRSA